MTALRLTYEDSRQFEMGVAKNVSEVRTAYAVKKKSAEVLKVCQKRNTYINHPNKSQDILKNQGNEASRILEKIDTKPTDTKAAAKKPKSGAAPKAAKRPPMRPESMGVKSKRRVIQGGAQRYNQDIFTDKTESSLMNIKQRPDDKESQVEEIEQEDTAVGNIVKDPVVAPFSGAGHILLTHTPYMEGDFVHLGDNMTFYQHDRKMKVNKEHYQPIFIARSVDEIRASKVGRKNLRKYNVVDDPEPKEEEAPQQPDLSSSVQILSSKIQTDKTSVLDAKPVESHRVSKKSNASGEKVKP